MQDFSPQRYDKMIYRKCGRWGLKLPAVSLGAWETYGGYRGEETARQCMFRAFDLGITHFGLANNYGKPPGNAESLVGKILKEMPHDEIIISSKAGYTMWPGPYGDWGWQVSHGVARPVAGAAGPELRRHFLPSPSRSGNAAGRDPRRSGRHRPQRQGGYCRDLELLRALADSACGLVAAGLVADHHSPAALPSPGTKGGKGPGPGAKARGFGVIVFSPLASGLLTDKYLDGIPSRFAGRAGRRPAPRLRRSLAKESVSRACGDETRSPGPAGSRWRRWPWPGSSACRRNQCRRRHRRGAG